MNNNWHKKEKPISSLASLSGGAGGMMYVSDAAPSGPRGVWGGGSSQNTIDFVTIATTGNATDFGDLITGRRWLAGCSNGSRGLFGGGYNTNQIQEDQCETHS